MKTVYNSSGFRKRKLNPLAIKELENNELPLDKCPDWMYETLIEFHSSHPEWVEQIGDNIYRLKRLTDKEILES